MLLVHCQIKPCKEDPNLYSSIEDNGGRTAATWSLVKKTPTSVQDPELLQRPNQFCISKYIYTGITVVRIIHHALENWTLILTHGTQKRVKICVRLKQMKQNQKAESIEGHILTLWSLTYWNKYDYICYCLFAEYHIWYIRFYGSYSMIQWDNFQFSIQTQLRFKQSENWNLVQILIFIWPLRRWNSVSLSFKSIGFLYIKIYLFW